MARIHVDNDTPIDLADALRDLGHDVVTAADLHLEDANDATHLSVAAADHRLLLTQNRKDFVLLFEAWAEWTRQWRVRRQHSGILIVHQYGAGDDRQIARGIETPFSRSWLPIAELWRYNWRHGWCQGELTPGKSVKWSAWRSDPVATP